MWLGGKSACLKALGSTPNTKKTKTTTKTSDGCSGDFGERLRKCVKLVFPSLSRTRDTNINS
jgi:hypothetical protein